jgi:RimJ/RimL family protein N-acetyltransferase
VPELRTQRLLLRGWRPADREPFATMNADPRVMEHFPELYTRQRSDAAVDRMEACWQELGYGLWAVERLDLGVFVGFVGLSPATFPAEFTPAVEIGWRLAGEHWGHGFATEGARAALRFGFNVMGLDEIVSFTARRNRPSWRVMERIGMVADPALDFDHPAVPAAHPVSPHVFYRMTRERWTELHGPTRTHDRAGS